MACYVCFFLFVLCLRTLLRRALAVLPSQSVLVFQSFFSSTFSSPSVCPPSALRCPGYSIKEDSGSRWMEASLLSKHTPAFAIFSSLTLYAVFSSHFHRPEHFSFFPAAVTHSVGGVEDKEGWRERPRESEQIKKKKEGKEQA